MRLLSVTLHNVGPFEDAVLRFGTTDPTDDVVADDGAAETATSLPAVTPRPVTLLFGADGTGKTSVLSSLAMTRPGHTVPPLPIGGPREGMALPSSPPHVATEWLLGEDDPERPHPLLVASPSAILAGETTESTAARRREQALFDRRAQHEGGYVFVSLSGARWFSRSPNLLTVPERTLLRYDVRQPNISFDDPTRADFTRETKQAISYAAIGAALAGGRAEYAHLACYDAAIRDVVDIVLEPFDLVYAGVHPTTLEPQARSTHGGVVPFDALPRAAKHLVAFVTLPLRALFAAYPGSDAPREREGVVSIDDIENQQEPSLLRSVVPLLQRALPNVQWILTTSSAQLALACDAASVVALRRTSPNRIEMGEGQLH